MIVRLVEAVFNPEQKKIMSDTIQRTSDEVSEIERHKYFLSERAGHDVGWDHAANDWEENYGEQFRHQHTRHPGGKGISFLFRRLFAKK